MTRHILTFLAIGFKQSDFAIINTDDPDDFRVEKEISLRDNRDAELKLKLHYL
jgi:vacuolar protein sorting-associated protein 13A/C